MDPLYYTRIAMAGWIFMVVVLASMWGSSSPEWNSFIKFIQETPGPTTAAVFGVIIGIGTPPAMGFLLERAASVILWVFKRNMWLYSCTETFRDALGTALESRQPVPDQNSEGAVFHIFFYTFADSKLLDWARRRRTQMYASLTSALAIISALLVTILMSSTFYRPIFMVSIIAVVGLAYHAWRESNIHEKAIAAWVSTLGAQKLKDFANEAREKKTETIASKGGV